MQMLCPRPVSGFSLTRLFLLSVKFTQVEEQLLSLLVTRSYIVPVLNAVHVLCICMLRRVAPLLPRLQRFGLTWAKSMLSRRHGTRRMKGFVLGVTVER